MATFKAIFFEGVKTFEELKQAYKVQARKLHPDMKDGNEKLFIAMKNEYDKLIKLLEKSDKKGFAEHTKNEEKFTYSDIIDKIIGMENGDIEIIGSWIWVWNVKFEHTAERTLLKSLGFDWVKGKKAWALGQRGRFWKRGMSKDDIRNEFGSEKITKKPTPLLD